MSTAVALWMGLALAAPDEEDLRAASRRADALIALCAAVGPRCGADTDELGRAFLARAVATAVLEGDLARQDVANARALAPDALGLWQDLLPSNERLAPDVWLVAWTEPAKVPRSAPGTPPQRSGAELDVGMVGARWSGGHTAAVAVRWERAVVLEAHIGRDTAHGEFPFRARQTRAGLMVGWGADLQSVPWLRAELRGGVVQLLGLNEFYPYPYASRAAVAAATLRATREGHGLRLSTTAELCAGHELWQPPYYGPLSLQPPQLDNATRTTRPPGEPRATLDLRVARVPSAEAWGPALQVELGKSLVAEQPFDRSLTLLLTRALP